MLYDRASAFGLLYQARPNIDEESNVSARLKEWPRIREESDVSIDEEEHPSRVCWGSRHVQGHADGL